MAARNAIVAGVIIPSLSSQVDIKTITSTLRIISVIARRCAEINLIPCTVRLSNLWFGRLSVVLTVTSALRRRSVSALRL